MDARKKVICLGANNPETIRFFRRISDTHELKGFIDNDPSKWGQEFFGFPIFGGIAEIAGLSSKGFYFVNLITRDCFTRHTTTLELLEQGAPLTNLIHPTVSLDMVRMGIGIYIQESVILQAEVVVGHNASIHMGSLIGHESTIGESAFVAHGCNLCGLVKVGKGAFVGAGATILPRLSIGEWSIVGAGSLVTKPVPPFTVVSGNPARKIRMIQPTDLMQRAKDLGLGDI